MLWKKTICAVVMFLGCAATTEAASVGDIQGVYFATNSFGIPATLDAPAFVFQNTSGQSITSSVFTILAGNGVGTADSFNIGTISAGGSFILETGITSDGGSGHTFFAINGGLDTSDAGFGGNVQFQFAGLQGSTPVSSGVFTPASSLFRSNDSVIASMNFLGGPGDNDGPCNNCYGPHVIATLSTPSGVPEPASWLLASLGLAGVLVCVRRATRNSTRDRLESTSN